MELKHRRLFERLNDLGIVGLESDQPWPEGVEPWKSGQGGVMDRVDSATWDQEQKTWILSAGGGRTSEEHEAWVAWHEARTGKKYPE